MKHLKLVLAAALVVSLYTGVTVAVASGERTLARSTPCMPALAGGDLFAVYSRLTPAAYGRGFEQREPVDNTPATDLPASAIGKAGRSFRASVPVYFHVVTDGSIGSLTRKQISDQMAVLNQNFGGSATGFGFTLAGVTRTDNAAWFYAGPGGTDEHSMKHALHQGGDIAARLDRLSVGPALAFVAIGIVLSDDVLGPISLEPEAEPIKLLAEVTLTLLLFADASTIRARALRQDAAPVARLLVVGLLLTIALGTVGALLLFPGTRSGVALLIGATLAPTDAALGQPVVTNPVVPARIRRLLNVESGLNDGIATPFVFLALALSTAEATGGSGWLGEAPDRDGDRRGRRGRRRVRRRLPAGLADRRRWTSAVSRQLFVLALALRCYLSRSASAATGSSPRSSAASRSGGAAGRREEAPIGSPRRRDRCWRSGCGSRSGSPSPASC